MRKLSRLSKTDIEYGDLAWNPYSGCEHNQQECPTANQCWARKITERFPAHYPYGFRPTFYPESLQAPAAIKQPKRILVAFMGDLFGAWNDGDGAMLGIMDMVEVCPQHQFLFLTKRPEALAQFNPWPRNAWVGISLTGAETPERQAAMLDALSRVEGAGVRWLSYEPALGPLAQPVPPWVDWLVVGAQSGKGAIPLERRWLLSAEIWSVYGIVQEPPPHSLWEKNNLARYLHRPLIQELPTP